MNFLKPGSGFNWTLKISTVYKNKMKKIQLPHGWTSFTWRTSQWPSILHAGNVSVPLFLINKAFTVPITAASFLPVKLFRSSGDFTPFPQIRAKYDQMSSLQNESESEAGISHVLRNYKERKKWLAPWISEVWVFCFHSSSLSSPVEATTKTPVPDIHASGRNTHPHCSPNNTCQLSVMVLELEPSMQVAASQVDLLSWQGAAIDLTPLPAIAPSSATNT